jgi:signal transduction histidine kinase/ligand-binding sensor domain-containing protein
MNVRMAFLLRTSLLIGLLCVASGDLAWALDPDRSISQFNHTTWKPNDGVPGNAWAMAQTGTGWLWLGTSTGLYRFDGLRFEHVQITPYDSGLSRSISALLPLESGELWIGRTFGGASVLQAGRWTHFGQKDGFGPGRVLAFEQDATGTIWAVTQNALLRFDGQRWHPVGKDWNLPDEHATSIARDSSGALWVSDRDELFSLETGSRVFRPSGVPSTPGTQLIRSSEGRLWSAENATIRALPTRSETRPGSRTVRTSSAVLIDSDGSAWFGTRQGLRRTTSARATAEGAPPPGDVFTLETGLSGDSVNAILEDREGNIWVATAGGLDRFRNTNISRYVRSAEAPSAVGFAAGNGGTIWMASQTNGAISKYDGVWAFNGHLQHVQWPQIKSATAIHRARDGSVWIGGLDGIWRNDGVRFTRVLEPPVPARGEVVQALATDAEGNVWVSFVDAGLFRFQSGTWQRNGNRTELPDIRPTVMATDALGRLWIGYRTDQLFVIDGDRVTSFDERSGLQMGIIAAISVGKYTLVGGENGVAVLRGDRFTTLRATDPTAVESVFGIVETSNGDVWLNNWRGAVRLGSAQIRTVLQNPAHELAADVFDSEDGYPGVGKLTRPRPLPTMVVATDGRIWMAGQDGVASIDPDRIRVNLVPPGVLIRSIRVDGGQATQPSDDLQSLPERTRTLEIDFAGISHTRPERVRFRYQLEGVDRAWVDSGTRREVVYSNLGPGRYRFRVTAANEHGVWNTSGASLTLVIPPAFWQTKTFMAYCVGVSLSIAVLLFRMRVNQLTARERARLQAQLRERERIARELHDTLLQGVQALHLRLFTILKKIPPQQPAHQMIEQAMALADQSLVEGRDRVQGLRSVECTASDLAEALSAAGRELGASRQQAELQVTTQGEPRSLYPSVRDEAYWIGREALANAFRHSEPTAVEVEVRYEWRSFRVHVRDDGRGISADVLKAIGRNGHWGIQGMHERARNIRGQVRIVSRPGSGTEVELRVPSGLAYRPKSS